MSGPFNRVVLKVFILIATMGSVQAQNNPSQTWAIAIHGGAGGNPATWTDRQKQARLVGLEKALAAGRDVLAQGGTALDAVEIAVRILEDDPTFNAGRGAVLNKHGNVELDACIMDGSNKACGAVAGVMKVRNPITLARRVMTETKHVLLQGVGADQFAVEQELPVADLSYFIPGPNEADQSLYLTETGAVLGTVGCVALDSHGNLAAGTSTGGLSGKMMGRVGDTPLVGAGTFAENGVCAVSATGIGEEFIRHSIAYDVAAQIKYGQKPLRKAVSHCIREVLRADTGGLISVAPDGSCVLQHNTPGMSCGFANAEGSFEVMLIVPPHESAAKESPTGDGP
jgi:beta-aspartyl-peptidase (threonine type)